MMKKIFILAIVLIVIGCQPKTTGSIQEVVLTDLQGKSIKLADYQGKVVFLNFWATWCGPCVKEMPSIQRASESLKSDEIVFLLASDESIDRIQDFASENNFELPLVRYEATDALNIQALPTTIILDKAGEVVYREIGMREWDSNENIQTIREILEKK